MQKITTGTTYPLYGVSQTRQIEQSHGANLPIHALMQRAGLAVARLALAIAPHAQRVWVACGPGNNGGDGLEAARHLHQWGKEVVVTWMGQLERAPSDTLATHRRLLEAGITIAPEPLGVFDVCIDALLGIGTTLREPEGQLAQWVQQLNIGSAPILSIDLPTGLDADTGHVRTVHVKATHTLSLLTLKPGLFTASGREAAGTVWFDQLEVDPSEQSSIQPSCQLLAKPASVMRPHDSHKGSYGDVAILGGASGMTGAALLAATAALHAGAGRVFVSLLDGGSLRVDTRQPELMFRPVCELDLSTMTVVCGCGGGTTVQSVLIQVLSTSSKVVIDADALNAIALDVTLQAALAARATRQMDSVLTPHPLEAARLLGLSAAQVQRDRLAAAKSLAERFCCTIVLKGSGSIIAAPQQVTQINPTGNARLATAGTGDVLAGMVGALLASGQGEFEAACHAVYRHGAIADSWKVNATLTASELAKAAGNAP